MRTSRFLLLGTAGLLLLAGCASPTTTGGGGAPPADSGSTALDLAVADSSLGGIVVDGAGMTVYYFDKDVPGSGESACVDQCAATWAAVHASSDAPAVEGVTAAIGTITGTDGELQVTLDGRPVYTFANDAAPGDVNGQGVNQLWYVIAADGSEVTAPPSTDPSY
jgi:predicted lipoprotein with Yx(FWY)xxD motif